MENIKNAAQNFISNFTNQQFRIADIFEILLLAFIIYHVILWVRKTQAWLLLKGIILILLFVLVADLLDLNVILWIFKNSINILVIVLVVVFQPELRKALDQLGRKNPITNLLTFDEDKVRTEKFSNRTVNEIVKAVNEMSKNMTGALIVLEQDTPLGDYERTGIKLDSVVSSQLLINIFEHNTPLHDGAVLLRQDRIVAATCYLPLSDNMELSKALGTRHRAGLGLSEVTDAVVIIVSEETGRISIAKGGELKTHVEEEYLRSCLVQSQQKVEGTKKIKLWKGRQRG